MSDKKGSLTYKLRSSCSGRPTAAKIECCEKKELSITELPDDVIFNIYKYIDISDHKRVRVTCHRLRDVSNYYLLHKFKMMHESAKKEKRDTNHFMTELLKTIYVATEVFFNWGYRSIFCGSFLPFLIAFNKSDFPHESFDYQNALSNFYDSVEISERENETELSLLMHITTLLCLLMDLTEESGAVVIEQTDSVEVYFKMPSNLTGMVILIVLLNELRYKNLLVILARIFFNHKILVALKLEPLIRSITDELGEQNQTYVHIQIFATHKVREFFHYVFQRRTDNIELPEDWRRYEFTIDIRVINECLENNSLNAKVTLAE